MRFTIRELMLLTLGIALGTGWWMHHRHEVALRLGLEEELAAERAEKQRMLSFSQEIVARLRRADPRFDNHRGLKNRCWAPHRIPNETPLAT